MAALVSASCAKENAMVPAVKTVITASVEEMTKTVLSDDNNVLWMSTDKLSVLSQGSNNLFEVLQLGNPATTATFTGELPAASQYYALYPYQDAAVFSGGTIGFTLPQEQKYAAGSFGDGSNPSIAAFKSPGTNLVFKNICGMFELSLTGSDTISKIELHDDSGMTIWGNATLAANDNIGTSAQSMTLSGGNNTIYLTGISATLSETPTTFRFVVPSGAFSAGFTAYVYNASGKICTILQSDKANVVNRSVIHKMPVAAVTPSVTSFNLSLAGSANSYVVPAAGTYTFKATKGEGGASVTPARVAVLWESDNTVTPVQIGSIVNTPSCSSDVISFKSTGKPGNAVIAAYDSSDNIVWSWHLWCTDSPVKVKRYDSGSVHPIVMDRQLGALTTDRTTHLSYGLVYQFGRKDPFTGGGEKGIYKSPGSTVLAVANPNFTTVSSNATTGNDAYANAHPSVFITGSSSSCHFRTVPDMDAWGGNDQSIKTANDPCPYGYTVPKHSAFAGLSVAGDAANFGVTLDGTEWFPQDGGRNYNNAGRAIGYSMYVVCRDYSGSTAYYMLARSAGFNCEKTSVNLAAANTMRCIKR